MVLLRRIENVLAMKPVFITNVIHFVADPSRRKDLCLFARPLGLIFHTFSDAGTNDVCMLEQQGPVDLVRILEAISKGRIRVRGPNDILFCGFILKQFVQYGKYRVTCHINQSFHVIYPPQLQGNSIPILHIVRGTTIQG